jgi:hypothetical protein
MHLSSSTEIALLASAITAASGWLVAVTVSYLNSRRDHKARLWERRANVYEYMLSQAAYWADLRRNAMFAMTRNDEMVEGPDAIAFEEDSRLLLARLELFGQRKVRDTYRRAVKEGMQFIGTIARYHNCQKANRENIMMGGEITSAAKSALSDAQSGLIAANEAATAAQMELITVARKAINQLPKLERGSPWERQRRTAAGSMRDSDVPGQVAETGGGLIEPYSKPHLIAKKKSPRAASYASR